MRHCFGVHKSTFQIHGTGSKHAVPRSNTQTQLECLWLQNSVILFCLLEKFAAPTHMM